MIKYLFLLLVLAACTAPKTETKQEEAEISSSLEAFVPKTKEDLDKLRTPVLSYEVLNRLIKVETAYSPFYPIEGRNPVYADGKSSDYRVLYFDPQDYKYYFGLFIPVEDLKPLADTLDFSGISKNPLENENRMVSFVNLSPSQRIYIDTGYYPERTNLFIETIRKTPDPYYIYIDDRGEQTIMNIFTDESGKIFSTDLILMPITNESYGKVSYEAIVNGKTNFEHAFYRDSDTGDIMGFTYLFPWLSWEGGEDDN